MANKIVNEFINKNKSKNKNRVTFFILFIVILFFLIFIPMEGLGIKANNNQIIEIAVKFATSGVFSFILRFLLFATDPLATGKSKESVFFKYYYPSIVIEGDYKIKIGQAQELWFAFFNTWSFPSSNYHHYWVTLFEISYACRLIFYIKNVLLTATIFSFLAILIDVLQQNSIQYYFAHELPKIIFFVMVFIAFLFLRHFNSPDLISPTGCWLKYKEISEIEHAIIEKELFLNAKNYKHAIQLVKEIDSKQSYN